jgi:histidinol phosphatase-like PHP family hydrolase
MKRRTFLAGAAAVAAARSGIARGDEAPVKTTESGIPLIDYHTHRDNSTVEKLLAFARERGVKLGIVEHAGTKENVYPVVLSNDDELKAYIASLAEMPVFKGVQAEWLDWASCFSKDAIAQLDYVLTDAMTCRNKDGTRIKMWEKGFAIDDAQKFMDGYADFYVEIMATEPIDIMANAMWLPGQIAQEYDAMWTEPRMKKVIDAAVKYNVAIEISSSFKVPRLPFLKLAKAAGVKFSFGSNGRGEAVAKLEHSLALAKELGLTPANMFSPAPAGKKPVQVRK